MKFDGGGYQFIETKMHHVIFSNKSKTSKYQETVKDLINSYIENGNINAVDFGGETLLDHARYRRGLIKANSEIIRFSE
jgi:hypothetical protein